MQRGGHLNLIVCDAFEYCISENGCFYTRGRIIRLDELGQTFIVRLVMRLLCLPKFAQMDNVSSSIKTANVATL